jgi:hypothetical protein
MKVTVEFPRRPHVIQVVIGAFQPHSEALKTISWLNEAFDLVGWIEARSSRFVGMVVADNAIYSSEGDGPIALETEMADNEGWLTMTGKVERLFYLRRVANGK